MITGRDFLVLSDDWSGLPTSTIHLFRQLSRRNRVFWFNVINRMPRFSWEDVKKVTGTLRAWGERAGGRARSNGHPLTSSDGVYSATPFIIPWFKPAIRRLNSICLRRNFLHLSRRYGIRTPIVFTTWPSTVDFVKTLGPALKIYYCVDEWLDYPGLNAADFESMENELLDHVDAFVATSRDLQRKGERCPASLYLPHGVDFQHFNREAAEWETVPRMDEIRRPIVGFFGIIAEWVDLNLIAALSKAFPQVSFVLIGKPVVGLNAVADCRNVHCLGPVPYTDLPRYAKYFDVGMIPFVTSKLTQAVNPLKLMEYLALGLPVLATRLPDLEQIDGPIHLASTAAEFCGRLQTMLEDSAFEARGAREVASRNTWEQRAEELSRFIESLSSNAT